MKICNYQDELLADLAVQPAQILDKIEACNKRTNAREDEHATKTRPLLVLPPASKLC